MHVYYSKKRSCSERLLTAKRIVRSLHVNSHLQFLVDPGVEVSFIPASQKDKHLSASCTLEAASCSPIDVYREHSMTLLFQWRPHPKLTWIFLIADVQQPFIGADFLAHHGFMVDLRRGSLRPTPMSYRPSTHPPSSTQFSPASEPIVTSLDFTPIAGPLPPTVSTSPMRNLST